MIGFKVLCVLACLGAATCSLEPNHLPPGSSSGSYSGEAGFGGGAHIPIIRYDNNNDGAGTYSYSYETGNGISAHESGAPRASGPEGAAVTSEGGFSYTAPNGQQISLTYTADENGFHPVGSHLPTSPPIPEAILRSIELNRQHASSDDGSYSSGQHNNNGGYNY